MFMSAPSLVWKAGAQLFGSGEIWNDLRVSGTELLGGYLLAVFFRNPFWHHDRLVQKDERYL